MAISRFSTSRVGTGLPKYQSLLAGRTRPNVVKTDLKLWVDASEPNSYSGTGSTWYDLSGNGKNGTLESVTYNSGSGGSMSFGGSGTVSFGNLGLTPSQATVQFFTKVNSNAGDYCAWVSCATSSGTDYETGFNVDMGSPSSSSVDFLNFEGKFKPGAVDWYPSSTAFGTWLNIAITFVASGAIVVYVNGSAVYTGSATAGGTFATERFRLGGRYAGVGGRLNGYIGSFMFYDRALTAAEVLQNHNASKTRFGL